MSNRKTRRSQQYKHDQLNQAILNQIHFDAYLITINELFHVGKGRVVECAETYIKAVDEITSAMLDGMDVAQARVDTRLKDIVPPEQFAPWPVRYNTKGVKQWH